MKTKILNLGFMLLGALILIAFLFSGCKKEPQEEIDNQVEANIQKIVNIDETGSNCTPIFAGQTTEVGTVCLEDDFDNNILTVTYTVTDGWEITEIHFDTKAEYAQIPMTKKGNLIPGQFGFNYSFPDGVATYTFNVPFSEIGATECDNDEFYYAAAHCALRLPDNSGGYQTESGWANGSMTLGNNWGMIFDYKMMCDYNGEAEQGNETSFAYGCDNATCFQNITDPADNTSFTNWGWSNEISAPGLYYFDLYADAGDCNISNGTLVGEVIVDYDGSTATVTFSTCGTYELEETHLYLGSDVLYVSEGLYTVAPSHFPYINTSLAPGSTSDSYTVSNLSGTVYLVAHAVVVGDYSLGDCGSAGCDFVPECNNSMLYATKNQGGTAVIYSIDPISGSTSQIASNSGYSTTVNINANAWDPVNNIFFFSNFANTGLYYYDIDNNNFGTCGNIIGDAASGTFYDGKYYYVDNGTANLYEVTFNSDWTINSVSIKYNIGQNMNYGDISMDEDGVLYGIGTQLGYRKLFKYENNQFVLIKTWNDGEHNIQPAFGSNGNLYGVDAASPYGVYIIDKNNGDLTLLSNLSISMSDLAKGPCN